MNETIKARLVSCKGLRCEKVVCGLGLGTTFSLKFGSIARTVVRETKRGKIEFVTFEFEIFVKNATWRVEDASSVICSSAADDNSSSSPLMLGLQSLKGRRIKEISIFNACNDLVIKFDNEVRVLVFSVNCVSAANENNYTIHFPETIYIVNFSGEVSEEKYGL